MIKVFTIGETVLDIIYQSFDNAVLKPGGAMLNTAVSLGRLGLPVSHISVTADDTASNKLISFLNSNGVDTSFIKQSKFLKTNLALAHLDENHNANYTFYKNSLDKGTEIKFPQCNKGDVILFGSFFSLNKAIHSQLSDFLKKAKKDGAIVIYDPNFRTPYLPMLEILKPTIKENITNSHIVKASDEDLKNIYNVSDSKDGWQKMNALKAKALIFTMGKNGACFFNNEFNVEVKANKVNVISTVGAGDTFSAGLIYFLFKKLNQAIQLNQLVEKDWIECLELATKFAAETCGSIDNYISVEFAKNMN